MQLTSFQILNTDTPLSMLQRLNVKHLRQINATLKKGNLQVYTNSVGK